MYAMMIDAGEEHVTKEQDLKWHVSHPKRGPDTGQLLLPATFDSLGNSTFTILAAIATFAMKIAATMALTLNIMPVITTSCEEPYILLP